MHYRPNTKDNLMINDDPTLISVPTEAEQLQDIEKSIRATLSSLSQFIRLLCQINQLNLYQSEYASFKQYCAERWAIDSRMVVMLHQMLTCLEEKDQDLSQDPILR